MSILQGLKRTLGKGLKSYASCLPGEVKEPQRTTYEQGPQDALGLQKKRTEMHWYMSENTGKRSQKLSISEESTKAFMRERISVHMQRAWRSQSLLTIAH